MASEEGERDYLDVWAQPWRQVLGDLLGMRSVSEYLARSIDAVPPTADHLRERVRAA